jgi:hypothetical protein
MFLTSGSQARKEIFWSPSEEKRIQSKKERSAKRTT